MLTVKFFVIYFTTLLLCINHSISGPIQDLQTWLTVDFGSRLPLNSQTFSNTSLTQAQSDSAKIMLWNDEIELIKLEGAAQWNKKNLVDDNGFKMPFKYKKYGEKPADGWDFYISMHGGGATSAKINNQQWENQMRL